jgi:lambda repressor-like predicted transcriptional regulator
VAIDEPFDMRKQQVDIIAKLPQEGSHVAKQAIKGSAKILELTLTFRRNWRWYSHLAVGKRIHT